MFATEAEQVYLLTQRAQGDETAEPYAFRAIGTVAGARRLAVPETGGHILVLTENGRVWAWGNNSNGQLGLGDVLAHDSWTPVDSLDGVTAIAGGALHSVALKRDGTVWTWGGNHNGQLGSGNLVGRTLPGAVPGLSDVKMIAAGWAFTLALRADGTVWAFGANWNDIAPGMGQRIINAPVQVTGLSGIDAIAVYRNRAYARDNQGRLLVWGKSDKAENSAITRLTGSEASQMMALLAHQFGQTNQPLPPNWAGGRVRIAGSTLHVTKAGKQSRYNFEGTLIDADLGWAVAVIAAPPVFEAGGKSAARSASTPDGAVTGGFQREAVTPGGTPATVAQAVTASALNPRISAAAAHSLAIKPDGTLWGWGQNEYGELGDGTTTTRLSPVQALISGVTQVSTGNTHTLVLKSDRTVWAFGYNAYGQLGDGTTADKATPVRMGPLDGVVGIASGRNHSVTVKSDGTVWSTGLNNFGQLGDGTTNSRNTPVQAIQITGVIAVAAGADHTLALKGDGTVWAWGSNGSGQLGDGTINNRTSAVQVLGLTNVIAIAAGYDYSLALMSDGTVWGWGFNAYGSLGDGSTTNRTTIVRVADLTGVIGIAAAGDYTSLAVKNDGSVWAWGYNGFGEIGDGTHNSHYTPIQATGFTGGVAVAAGDYFSLALKNDGTIWAWGHNDFGQFGNGTTNDSNVPTQGPGGFAAPTSGTALKFVTVTPCRVADTRNANGAFGGPAISGQTSRTFTIPNSACGIPSNAAAYSLNVTVVPITTVGYLTAYPTGQPVPLASTLNSLDGRVKANAAIVPAGTGGAINLFVTDTTHVILDINGYFVPTSGGATLTFFPLTPCRVADTRSATGALGGPFIPGNQSRSFPVQSSACNVPATAQAYSLNFTAVPHGSLGYISTYPTGSPLPLVSTLNAINGLVTANAAIVPAGSGGAITTYAANDTDLVIDINGYFAPSSAGGLSLYNVTPCRVLDSRNPSGAPPMTGTQSVSVSTSLCGVPGNAQAYVFGATVAPATSSLGYLSLWPQGQSQPLVSTLNSLDGSVTSNMAIVPTTNGSIYGFLTDSAHLILDISGYLAP